MKPPSGNGKLLWHALGAKTVELINENVHVESVRDDVETLVLDAQVLEEILTDAEPGKKRARKSRSSSIARLRKHPGNPKFTALGERLEKIKERHEQGFLTSLEFLKEILELAQGRRRGREANRPRRRARPGQGSADRTVQRSEEHATRTSSSSASSRDIDDIVKKVRFPDWQAHQPGRAAGAEGTAADAPEVQAAHRPGSVRQSLRLHPAVLLAPSCGTCGSRASTRRACTRCTWTSRCVSTVSCRLSPPGASGGGTLFRHPVQMPFTKQHLGDGPGGSSSVASASELPRFRVTRQPSGACQTAHAACPCNVL